jgi:heme A synthase
MDRLSEGEKLLGSSALALYVISFISFWAEIEVEQEGSRSIARVTAWDGYGPALKAALVLAVVAVGLVAARAAAARFDLPVPWGFVYVGTGALTLLLVLVAILVGPEESIPLLETAIPASVRIEANREVGLFVGTLLAGAMVAGGYQHMKSGDAITTPDRAPSASPPTTPTGA